MSAKIRRAKKLWPRVLRAARSFLEEAEYAGFKAEQPNSPIVECPAVEAMPATRGSGSAPATNRSSTAGKRAIRLKEFPKSMEMTNTPPDSYLASCDSSLDEQPFKMVTDQNGFILPEPVSKPDCPVVIFLGDSTIEGKFAHPETRLCSRLQDILSNEEGVHVAVLNAGYSGATALHCFNTFMNKIIPLRPAAVVLMTGVTDAYVSVIKGTFWSRDCWVEPIIDIEDPDRDEHPDGRTDPSFDDQRRLMTMFAAASRTFDVPVWYATAPHRQVYEDEYVRKVFKSRAAFDFDVSPRKAVNDVTRQIAMKEGVPLFDLEADLAHRTEIFYDMYHLNAVGGEAVARSLIKGGFISQLQLLGVG